MTGTFSIGETVVDESGVTANKVIYTYTQNAKTGSLEHFDDEVGFTAPYTLYDIFYISNLTTIYYGLWYEDSLYPTKLNLDYSYNKQ